MRLHHSNRMEILAAALARIMRADPGDPFDPERIVVPHPTIGRWLELELARELGIAANLHFEQPAAFAWSIMRCVVPGLSGEQPYAPARLRWRILDLLPHPAEEPGEGAASGRPAGGPPGSEEPAGGIPEWEAEVRGYLRDGDPRKRLELADRLARVYDRCLNYRPDWIREWEGGTAPHWQARLWQRLVEADDAGGVHHWVRALDEFRSAFRNEYGASDSGDTAAGRMSEPLVRGRLPAPPADHRPLAAPARDEDTLRPAGWPRRVSFFAVPGLSPSYLELLRRAAQRIEVHLFVLNPCQEYWGDIHSRREIDFRAEGADPDTRYLTQGNELLAAWGRAGRDTIDALVEVSDASWEEHFVPPEGAHRLAAVQRDLLELRLASPAASAASSFAGAPVTMPAGPSDGRTPAAEWSANRKHAARPPARDDSLQIHVCHSPVREAEVLHDRLLALFDEHRDLEPADVLVLTPDLEVHGPAIEAVFAAAGRIPCNVSRARAVGSRTLRAFLDLVSLPGSRHGTEAVLAPLAAPATRARFGIAEAGLPAIRAMVRRAGIRWGVDAAHRSEEDLPETADHTWRHGLRRLLLGHAMTDADALVDGIVPCPVSGEGYAGAETDGELLGRFVSYCEEAFGLRERLSGALRSAHWGEVLRDVVQRFFADGSQSLLGAGRRVADPPARELAAEVDGIRALVRDFEREAGRAASPVPFEVVLDVLRESAREDAGGVARLADAVTVTSLRPGRIVPAEVVCAAGMNDGVFPRSPPAPSFDLVAAGRARRGDRDVRYEDRYAFLEALLAARRCFIVTYAGRGLRDDASIPPSVLVDELKEYLDRRFPGAAVEIRHPLQPFSPRYFEACATGSPCEVGDDPAGGTAGETDGGCWNTGGAGTGIDAEAARRDEASVTAAGTGTHEAESDDDVPVPRGSTRGVPASRIGAQVDLFSYSRGMCEAAKTMRAGREEVMSPPRLARVELPEPDSSRRCVDLAELSTFFANPTRHLLRERLGLRLELADLALEQDEPFELDDLERHHLRSEVWERIQAGVEPERAAALLRGSGRLPHAGLGRIAYEGALRDVEPLEERLAPYRRAVEAPPREIDFELGDFRVVGAVAHIEPREPGGEGSGSSGPDESAARDAGLDRLVWWRIGGLRARDRIDIRLRQLAWEAAGHGPVEAVVVWRDRGSWRSAAFPPPGEAREELARWLRVWWQGLATPLPFFPESSLAFASVVARSGDEEDGALEAARVKAEEVWLGTPFRRGERLDPYLGLVHDGGEPLADRFEDLATELLVPLAGSRP